MSCLTHGFEESNVLRAYKYNLGSHIEINRWLFYTTAINIIFQNSWIPGEDVCRLCVPWSAL